MSALICFAIEHARSNPAPPPGTALGQHRNRPHNGSNSAIRHRTSNRNATAAASPTRNTVVRNDAIHKNDIPPKLSDTLNVAKSPFEPITLVPPALPDARNSGQATTGNESAVSSTPDFVATTERSLESPAAQSLPVTSSSTAAPISSTATSNEASDKAETAASSTTTTSNEALIKSNEVEEHKHTTRKAPDEHHVEDKDKEASTTKILEDLSTSASEERASTESIREVETTSASETTTEAPTTTTTSTTMTTTTTTTTAAPETTTTEMVDEDSTLNETDTPSGPSSEGSTTLATLVPDSPTSTERDSITDQAMNKVEKESSNEVKAEESTTTPLPEEPKSESETTTSTTPELTTTTTVTPAPTTTSTTTPAPTTTPVTPDTTTEYPTTTESKDTTGQSSATSSSPEPDSSTRGPEPDIVQPQIEPANEPERETGGPAGDSQSSTVPEPSTTSAPTTTTTEAHSTTTTTTTTTQKPAEESRNKENKPTKEESRPGFDCNHLPTYDTDEIQKVFREETTFRNGTIRGKFTYINFDQRYRLVHYTRLPYGPVRIDLVEELGKPDSHAKSVTDADSRLSSPMNDVPNAVLQLRNILPNSLFGFPFLGPNSGQIKPMVDLKERGSVPNDDRSNMYFYSTDTIATPNLLTPSVPVSLLPGQRLKVSHSINNNVPAADMIGQNYFNQAIINSPNLSASPKQSQRGSQSAGDVSTLNGSSFKQPDSLRPLLLYDQSPAQPQIQPFGQSNGNSYNHQIQYATVSQDQQQPSSMAPEAPQQPMIQSRQYIHSFAPHAPHQYSTYSQPPVFVPNYAQLPLAQDVPAAGSSADGAPVAGQAIEGPGQQTTLYQDRGQHRSANEFSQQQQTSHQSMQQIHQTHQPPSHEHYVAPFMFLQSPSNDQQSLEASRVKIRVKTSKALHANPSEQNFGTKSAQLRAPSSSGNSAYTSPVTNSGNRNHRRLGKQNQELNKNAVNTTPVVYHILRSPHGKLYTSLSQYNAAVRSYSMAYDQDK